jgi:hypothetical protein
MFWVALIMALLALLQVPSLVNRKQWGELAGYALVWTIAAAYALLVAARAPVPRPIEVLRLLLQALYRSLGLEIQI